MYAFKILTVLTLWCFLMYIISNDMISLAIWYNKLLENFSKTINCTCPIDLFNFVFFENFTRAWQHQIALENHVITYMKLKLVIVFHHWESLSFGNGGEASWCVWQIKTLNPLTPKMLLSILPYSCCSFPCKIFVRIWCWIKITTYAW